MFYRSRQKQGSGNQSKASETEYMYTVYRVLESWNQDKLQEDVNCFSVKSDLGQLFQLQAHLPVG